MNIAFIGLGGVGGFYGGKFAKLAETNDDLNVYFIARNQHLEAIKSNGLTIKLADRKEIVSKPYLATERIVDLPKIDVCFICVKSYDLHDVLIQVKDKLHNRSRVIPLLNGADIHERVRSVVTNAIVYPACVYISTYIEKPGVVIQTTPRAKIVLGPDPAHPEDVPTKLLTYLDTMNLTYDWTEKVFEEIWKKYLFIAPFSLVTASNDKSIRQIYEDEVLSRDTLGIMKEIVQIATKKGVTLTDDTMHNTFHSAKSLPHESTTSFQRDYSKPDKQNEKEIFGQVIIDMGKEFGVPTPMTEKVFSLLR